MRRTHKPRKLQGKIVRRHHDGWIMTRPVWEKTQVDKDSVTMKLVDHEFVLTKSKVDPADWPRLTEGLIMRLPSKRGPRQWHVQWTQPRRGTKHRYSITMESVTVTRLGPEVTTKLEVDA